MSALKGPNMSRGDRNRGSFIALPHEPVPDPATAEIKSFPKKEAVRISEV